MNDDSIKNSVINFFKIAIKENEANGKRSRCLNLVGRLQAKGNREMKRWFLQNYPHNSSFLKFFRENNFHFEYDDYTGIIILNENRRFNGDHPTELALMIKDEFGEWIENVIGIVESVSKSKAAIAVCVTIDEETKRYAVVAVDGLEGVECVVNDMSPLDFRHHLKVGDKVKIDMLFYAKGVIEESLTHPSYWIVKRIETPKSAVLPAAEGDRTPDRPRARRESPFLNARNNEEEMTNKFNNKCHCHKHLRAMSKLPFEVYQRWAELHRDLILDVYVERLMIRQIFDGKSNYDLITQMAAKSGPISLRTLIGSMYYAFK